MGAIVADGPGRRRAGRAAAAVLDRAADRPWVFH